MGIDVLIAVLAAAGGVFGILTGISKSKRDSSLNVLKTEIGNKQFELEEVLSKEEIENFVKKIEHLDAIKKETKHVNKQRGSTTKNFLVYIVPGVVALALVGLYVYLRMTNGDDPEYVVPEDLSSLMTVIVGYLFGAGAASA